MTDCVGRGRCDTATPVTEGMILTVMVLLVILVAVLVPIEVMRMVAADRSRGCAHGGAPRFA